MRKLKFVASAALTTLWAAASVADATAFTSSIGKSEGKTTALVRPGGPKMAPYSAAIHQLILDEVRRTHVPFVLASPAIFVVVFRLDRSGQVVQFAVARNGGLQVIDEYLEMVVRRAARQFPPSPANAGNDLKFGLPISFH
jgi:hypothetical protein